MDRKKEREMEWWDEMEAEGGHNQQLSNMVESGNQFDYGEEVGLAGGGGREIRGISA